MQQRFYLTVHTGMTRDKPQSNRYWRRVGATRRHIYYVPNNNLPGMLLFGLIGVGGASSVVAATWHLWQGTETSRDGWLVGIGVGLVWLAVAQGRRLLKDS